MARDAPELARLLASQIERLVAELLPAGRRDGHEWVHSSLYGTSRRSLSVHLTGAKRGVWGDFSSGERGDALDLVAHVLHRGEVAPAMIWARAWLGLGDGALPAGDRHATAEPVAPEADTEARKGAAKAMFLSGQERLAGTPVAAYLAGRGIDLGELQRQPRSLRFHHALWNRESARTWPAMLAAVTDDRGEMTAVHRTWLHKAVDGRWTKAPLRNPKMSFGQVSGSTIRLWRGASGRSLAQAPEDDAVAIGEGIETCLSVVVACPELRTLACVSLAHMALIRLPPAVRTVVLLKDEDGDNMQAAKAFARAVDHFLEEGRIVRVARPPVGKDFNDALLADPAG